MTLAVVLMLLGMNEIWTPPPAPWNAHVLILTRQCAVTVYAALALCRAIHVHIIIVANWRESHQAPPVSPTRSLHPTTPWRLLLLFLYAEFGHGIIEREQKVRERNSRHHFNLARTEHQCPSCRGGVDGVHVLFHRRISVYLISYHILCSRQQNVKWVFQCRNVECRSVRRMCLLNWHRRRLLIKSIRPLGLVNFCELDMISSCEFMNEARSFRYCVDCATIPDPCGGI